MKTAQTFLVILFLLILISSSAAASTLSIGRGNYNARISRFNSSVGSDITLISVGYGQDQYSGVAADLFSSDNASGLEVEYQFIPTSMQDRREKFNYAAKIGAVSGDIWEEDSSGIKAGVVIERQLDFERKVYFETDVMNTSALVIDSELGFYGKFSKGVWGILSYKITTHDEYDTAQGFNYGIRIDF